MQGPPSSEQILGASYVVGVGLNSDASPAELDGLVTAALTEGALGADHVCAAATIESRREHPAMRALAWPLVTFTSTELAAVATPTPSARIDDLIGTPSVAEAAALLAAGAGAELVVTKRSSAHATVAIAGRPIPSDPCVPRKPAPS